MKRKFSSTGGDHNNDDDDGAGGVSTGKGDQEKKMAKQQQHNLQSLSNYAQNQNQNQNQKSWKEQQQQNASSLGYAFLGRPPKNHPLIPTKSSLNLFLWGVTSEGWGLPEFDYPQSTWKKHIPKTIPTTTQSAYGGKYQSKPKGPSKYVSKVKWPNDPQGNRPYILLDAETEQGHSVTVVVYDWKPFFWVRMSLGPQNQRLFTEEQQQHCGSILKQYLEDKIAVSASMNPPRRFEKNSDKPKSSSWSSSSSYAGNHGSNDSFRSTSAMDDFCLRGDGQVEWTYAQKVHAYGFEPDPDRPKLGARKWNYFCLSFETMGHVRQSVDEFLPMFNSKFRDQTFPFYLEAIEESDMSMFPLTQRFFTSTGIAASSWFQISNYQLLSDTIPQLSPQGLTHSQYELLCRPDSLTPIPMEEKDTIPEPLILSFDIEQLSSRIPPQALLLQEVCQFQTEYRQQICKFYRRFCESDTELVRACSENLAHIFPGATLVYDSSSSGGSSSNRCSSEPELGKKHEQTTSSSSSSPYSSSVDLVNEWIDFCIVFQRKLEHYHERVGRKLSLQAKIQPDHRKKPTNPEELSLVLRQIHSDFSSKSFLYFLVNEVCSAGGDYTVIRLPPPLSSSSSRSPSSFNEKNTNDGHPIDSHSNDHHPSEKGKKSNGTEESESESESSSLLSGERERVHFKKLTKDNQTFFLISGELCQQSQFHCFDFALDSWIENVRRQISYLFPQNDLDDDSIINIGCVLSRGPNIIDQRCFCLKETVFPRESISNADESDDKGGKTSQQQKATKGQLICSDQELEMLHGFWYYITHEANPTIITGFNIHNYDIDTMFQRAKKLSDYAEFDCFFHLSAHPWQRSETETQTSHSKAKGFKKTFKWGTRIIIDMYQYVKGLPGTKLPYYGMNEVCQAYDVPMQKIDMPVVKLCMNFIGTSEERGENAMYCLRDCEMPLMLLYSKLMVVETKIIASQICRQTLQDVCIKGSSRVCQELMIFQAHDPSFNMIVNMPEFYPKQSGYEGALVLDAQSGIYPGVITVDFSSLYPSIIYSHRLCPSNWIYPRQSNRPLEGKSSLSHMIDRLGLTTTVYHKDLDLVKEPADIVQYHCNGDDHPAEAFSRIQPGVTPSIVKKMITMRKQVNAMIKHIRFGLSPEKPSLERCVENDWSQEDADSRLHSPVKFQELRKDIQKQLQPTMDYLAQYLKETRQVMDRWTRAELLKAIKRRLGYLDLQQNGFKIIINSLYGYEGMPPEMSKYSCIPISASVTLVGRNMLTLSKELVETGFRGAEEWLPYPMQVLYGDTDSLMIRFKEGVSSLNQIFDLGTKVASQISQIFKGKFPDTIINLEMEKVTAPFGLMQKKMYAGFIYMKRPPPPRKLNPETGLMEGLDLESAGPKFDVKGYKLKKSDVSLLTRNPLKQLLDVVFRKPCEYTEFPEKLVVWKETLPKLILQYLEQVVNNQLPNSAYVITKSLSKEEYSNPEQIPQYIVQQQIKNRAPGSEPKTGDKVQMVYCWQGPDPSSSKPIKAMQKVQEAQWAFDNHLPIDIPHYLKNELANPLGRFMSLFFPDPDQFLNDAIIQSTAKLSGNNRISFSSNGRMMTQSHQGHLIQLQIRPSISCQQRSSAAHHGGTSKLNPIQSTLNTPKGRFEKNISSSKKQAKGKQQPPSASIAQLFALGKKTPTTTTTASTNNST